MEGGANWMRREVQGGRGGDQSAAREGHVVSYELRIGQLEARMSKVSMFCTCKVDEKKQLQVKDHGSACSIDSQLVALRNKVALASLPCRSAPL